MRAVGVGVDRRVVRQAVEGVLVGQRLETVPQGALEGEFVEVAGALEHDDEALEQGRVEGEAAGGLEQARVDAQIVPGRGDVAGDDDGHLAAGEGRLGPDAGEGLVADEGLEGAGERVIVGGDGGGHAEVLLVSRWTE